jgi:hypothetical protein
MNKKEFKQICAKYKLTVSYAGANQQFYVTNYHGTVTDEQIEQFKEEVKDSFKYELK